MLHERESSTSHQIRDECAARHLDYSTAELIVADNGKKRDMPSLGSSSTLSTCSSAASLATEQSSNGRRLLFSSPKQQRTIFPEYWKGSKENLALSTPDSNNVPTPLSPGASKKPINEPVSDNRHDRATPPSSNTQSKTNRRNIFGKCNSERLSSSLPSNFYMSKAARTPLSPLKVRKTRSTSALLPIAQQKSCLRSVQVYSSPDFKSSICSNADQNGNSRRPTLRTSDSSVSFSPEIDVIEFDRTQERFAEDGWAKNFA